MESALTLESESTLISVVMFPCCSLVLTSAKNSSPFLVPDDVITCDAKHKLLHTGTITNNTETEKGCKYHTFSGPKYKKTN